MRKLYTVFPILFLFVVSGTIYFSLPKYEPHPNRVPFIIPESEEELEKQQGKEVEEEENKDRYDGPAARDQQEFDWMVDPALGYVPYTRLNSALAYTHYLRDSIQNSPARTQSIMLWQERGPIYDSVGPSNGNTRGNDLYTAGRMRAVLIDTLNDPTGNTAIVGGVSGGVWKCTNFLSAFPNWKNVNDYFDNMAISSICQDPSNPAVMYFSTGEAASNADAHFGAGVWKSTDKGDTWQQLPSSVNFIRNWKIVCDAAGNVYLASRTTATPSLNTVGLARSDDGGVTWTNITPTAQGTATSTATCTDLEYTTTGKLIASFGYTTAGTAVKAYVTNNPATVTQATWTLGTGIRVTGTVAVRMELAALADTIYAVTVNTSHNADSCYKSINGGVTWTKQNTAIMPGGVLSGQGWYNETLAINPSNSNELMCGGLDAYRSLNGGLTWTRATFWVTSIPYVHADHHYMHWWKRGNQSQIVIGCDGGVFYSTDGGVVWLDKNRNLGLKQFYGADIHPAAGSPYLLAGAQDNGTHQIKNPGLTYSHEVTGGDGMHVWINQQDPNIQFASYVYNQYRRSTNGGASWSSLNLNTNTGMFANPYAVDETQNILYGCYSANNLLRWPSASTAGATAFNTVAITPLNGAQIGSLKVSPYTANRLFLGSNGGRVIRVDNANAATPVATNISGTGFTSGFIRSVNVGSSDNNIVATYSNFGVAQVWVTTDGGINWTNVDGNLPDMPVWWGLFDPHDNSKMYLGTETGVWTTDLLNGSSTYWIPNPGIPTTRVAMLRMRSSDNTVVASTYGRGLFTARIPPSTPEISFVQPSSIAAETREGITSGASGCRSYKDYVINTGIVNNPTGDATVTYSIQAGGTATRGVDFDFTTNGNFSNPSATHLFPNAQMVLRPITIRIYDDADVESPESFTLTYTISGTTNAISGPVNAHVFTITDNDRPPVPFGTNDYAVGNFTVDMSTLNTPFDATKLKHRLQVIYRASELQASGISISAVINSIKLKVKTKNTTQPFKAFTIQIANTYKVNLASGFVTGIPFTQVYSGDYSTVAGVNTFNFPTPFIWDGTSNVVIQFCFDNTGGTAEGVTDVVEGMSRAIGTGIRASVYSNHTTATGAGCSLAAAFVDDNRVNTTFNATFGDKVATALNSEKTESLGARNDPFYYTTSGQVMARVLNLSDHNYGCTQVIIDRAGTGVKQFWNANSENYLMDKTFRILPTTNNATGRHEVTFYFTKAEKEGWEAATGQSWDDIQIVKLPSRINNVTPANAQPDGAGSIKVIDAVRRTFGPDYYTLSGIFETGFSGYGFGVPGRMTTLLGLTGQASGPNINLSWSTSVEINSGIFEVEKAYDGFNWHRIGTVQAAGNKLTPSNYTSVDPENVQYNYYRIKMQHSDGYVLYSNTIFIRKDDAPQRIVISPNPFTNYINVVFARPSTGRIFLSFYDSKGALVKREGMPANTSSHIIRTDDLVSSGIYTVRIDYDGNKFVKTLLKK